MTPSEGGDDDDDDEEYDESALIAPMIVGQL